MTFATPTLEAPLVESIARDAQALPHNQVVQPVFIVGQYKCGSTWLLNILSAHPQVVGVEEIDIIRAAYDFHQSAHTFTPVKERLHRFFDGSGWCAYHDGSQWKYNDVVARYERGEPLASAPGDRTRPQRFMNLEPDVALNLFQRIRDAASAHDALDSFLEAACAGHAGITHTVLKACDQIAVFDALQAWKPEAKKIVITRDGRDAAISGLHFTKLMNELNAPFSPDPNRDYFDLLKAWGHRANMIIDRAGAGELWLLRYEDLSRNFTETLAPLLEWLGLDSSRSLIESIETHTSFEKTTGRARGTEAKHVFRKGAVGEWIDVLTAEDKHQAWNVAKKQLMGLGYTEDGSIRPLPVTFGCCLSSAERLRKAVQSVVPAGSTVLVISKGDEELVKIGDPIGWHFPQGRAGEYAGYYPADSAEAIAHLELLRGKGAGYLVIPAASHWWLEHYEDFSAHLQNNARPVFSSDELCVVYAFNEIRPIGDGSRAAEITPVVGTPAISESNERLLLFQCNICGKPSSVKRGQFGREVRSCMACGSTVRWRSVIHVLSRELFHDDLALVDFPVDRSRKGIGMSDWGGYALGLANKFSYKNTFYHTEPHLDITAPPDEMEGTLDFIITSDVFEHIAPPVSVAFRNLRKLLKPGGVVVFTVPYGAEGRTTEHFPDLHDYAIESVNGGHILVNRTKEGTRQVFDTLVFHGGPGATLEMRVFSEQSLIDEFRQAGFSRVTIHRDECLDHGILWESDCSLPISAQVL